MFIYGIGGTFYNVLGIPYGDDNTEKDNGPFMLGIMWGSKFFGPLFGYLLASACLKVYVNPGETTSIEEGNRL